MLPSIQFLQAKAYRRGRLHPVGHPQAGQPCGIDLVVIHSAEIGESLEGAEALMRVCAKGRVFPPGHPKAGQPSPASWHYSADADSICQSVLEGDTAFHAPGASHRAIGIELSGRARQTADEWDDDFSTRMLDHVAQLVAAICRRWTLPIAFVDAEGLRRGDRGITTHAAVSKAWGKSSHWDPGEHFPMERFVEMVLFYYDVQGQQLDTLPPDTDPSPPPSERAT